MSFYKSGLDKAHVFVCDECGDEHDTGEQDFTDAKDHFKSTGGAIRRAWGGRWEHFCETCAE